MTPEILKWMKSVENMYTGKEGYSVLEIGSRNINGTARSVFKRHSTYVGIDMEEGLDVDFVINAHDIFNKEVLAACGISENYFPEEGYDIVICAETLEHDDAFWVTVDVLKRSLKEGGLLVITTPTYGFPYHGYPKDYYRFSYDTYMDVFFKGMTVLTVDKVFDMAHNPCLCGAAIKN